MAELADAQDLKSWVPKGACGFDSHPRHYLRDVSFHLSDAFRWRSLLLRLQEIDFHLELRHTYELTSVWSEFAGQRTSPEAYLAMFATAIRDDNLDEAKAIWRMPEFRKQLDAILGPLEPNAKGTTDRDRDVVIQR